MRKGEAQHGSLEPFCWKRQAAWVDLQSVYLKQGVESERGHWIAGLCLSPPGSSKQLNVRRQPQGWGACARSSLSNAFFLGGGS